MKRRVWDGGSWDRLVSERQWSITSSDGGGLNEGGQRRVCEDEVGGGRDAACHGGVSVGYERGSG